MKRESLSERLIIVYEEKTKLECENQVLRKECIAYQKAIEQKKYEFTKLFELWDKTDATRNELRDKYSELTAYCHLAKLLFERCGAFIVKNKEMLSVSDYLIEELGLNNLVVDDVKDEPSEVPKKSDIPDDDIVDMFKQSTGLLTTNQKGGVV